MAQHGTLNFASVNGYQALHAGLAWPCYFNRAGSVRHGTVDKLKQTLLYPWLLYVNMMASTMAKRETKSSYHVRFEISCPSSGSR